MTRKIIVCSQKGGVGKTTTAVNLAVGLARLDQKVLIIDSDSQASTTIALGFDKRNIGVSLYELLTKSSQEASPIIRTCIPDKLWCIPASALLASAEIDLAREVGKEFLLREKLEDIENDYDFIIIDCSPGVNVLTINAMFLNDSEILIPIQSQFYALEGIDQLLYTVVVIKTRMNHSVSFLGALCTMYDRRNKISLHILSELDQLFAKHLFSTVITVNTQLSEAPSMKQSIFDFAPSSKGAQDYASLAKEILAPGSVGGWRSDPKMAEKIANLDPEKSQALHEMIVQAKALVDKVLAVKTATSKKSMPQANAAIKPKPTPVVEKPKRAAVNQPRVDNKEEEDLWQ